MFLESLALLARERERHRHHVLGSGTCNRFSMVFVAEETWWSIMLGGQLC